MKKEINKEEKFEALTDSIGVVKDNTGKLAGPIYTRKEIICYDLGVLPENETVESVIKKYKEEGVLIYDTSKLRSYGTSGLIKAPYTITL